jgi:hypothetical protein
MQDVSTLQSFANTVVSRFNNDRLWRSQLTFGGASLNTWFERTYRMYNGIHDPEEVSREKARSGVDISTNGYFSLARLKVDAASAHILSKYQHAMEAPFVLQPSNNPELNKDQESEIRSGVAQKLIEQLNAGGLNESDIWDSQSKKVTDPAVKQWLNSKVEEMRVTVREGAINLSKEACSYHHGFIADQLDNGGWNNAGAVLIHNLCAEPYTALCARENRSQVLPKWKGNKVVMESSVIPTFRALNPRNLYLASDAISAQTGAGVTELTLRSRADLISLYKTDDDSIIKENILDCISRMTSRNTDALLNQDWLGTGHANQIMLQSLVHQGLFSGDELSRGGIKGYGATDYINATVEVFLGRVIRFSVLPYENNQRNYYTAQHVRSSNSYAGESILTKLYHIQNEVNMAMYLRKRNMYHASGPSLLIHGNAFNRPESFRLTPFSHSFSNPSNLNGNGRAVDQINVTPIFRQIDEQLKALMVQADEIAGIPSLFSGLSRGGLSRNTLGGAVLEQTNGERVIDMSIINLDTTLIEPMIEHLHYENLTTEKDIPKEYKRGDIKVQGRGIYGLKEVELKQRLLTQSLPMLMQTTQAGVTPTSTLEGALKDYYSGSGIDTSAIASQGSQREFASAGLNPPQTSDQRTYNPQQSMTGVA